MGQGRLSDAELVALSAMVQADAVDVECENKRVFLQQESVARLNNDVCNVDVRSVFDCESYKRLVEEILKRGVM
jgi:hypothetical protein